jgi:hypothetical protein
MDTDTGSDRDTDMDRNRARDTYISSYFFTTSVKNGITLIKCHQNILYSTIYSRHRLAVSPPASCTNSISLDSYSTPPG